MARGCDTPINQALIVELLRIFHGDDGSANLNQTDLDLFSPERVTEILRDAIERKGPCQFDPLPIPDGANS